MKMKKMKFFHKGKSLSRLLFEQEDVFADVEEEGGEEEAPAEEEPAEEGGEEEPAGDEEAADEGEGEGEGEDDEKLDVDPEEEVKLSKSIDQDLEALLIDFEAEARKAKEIEGADEEIEIATEGLTLKMLIEQDAPPEFEQEIDLDRFSAEVARLVKNYTTLLDMEKMIINKAREFVLTRYGDEAETSMLNLLASKHDIEIVSPNEPLESENQVPIAVGAGTPAAGV